MTRPEDHLEEMVRTKYQPFSGIHCSQPTIVERLRRYKGHITLADYEIHNKMSFEMYLASVEARTDRTNRSETSCYLLEPAECLCLQICTTAPTNSFV